MVGVTGSIPVAPTINRSEKCDEAVGDLRKAGADVVDPVVIPALKTPPCGPHRSVDRR
jgi:hypothetical protein